MVRDTRYTNTNFTKNKLKFLNNFENMVEVNTKYHKIWSMNERKKYLFDEIFKHLSADSLLLVLFFSTETPKNLHIWLLLGFIALILLQTLFTISIFIGNEENISEYKQDVQLKEYLRFLNVRLPLETLPDSMTDNHIVYSKPSFDRLLEQFDKNKKIKELIVKYKKLAFKSDKIISNNKKIIRATLKAELEQLEVVHTVPISLFDWEDYWREQGYDEQQVQELWESKELEYANKK